MTETPQPPERPDADPARSDTDQAGAHTPPPPADQPSGPAQQAPSRSRRAWVAAAVGAALLLGGGTGGYFIGAATADSRPDRRAGNTSEFGPGHHHGPGMRFHERGMPGPGMPGEPGEFPGGPPWHDRSER